MTKMRHLEKPPSIEQPFFIKEEIFENLTEPKDIPSLLLEDCDSFIRNEFAASDDESIISTCIKLELTAPNHNESDNSSEECSSVKSSVRRNKRKLHLPQRAVQIEFTNGGSAGNSSESSQDLPDNYIVGAQFVNENIITGNNDNLGGLSGILLSNEHGGCNRIELSAEDELLPEISEDGIFKNLQEEADGEKIDDEIIDNVKEEWRAHWGVKCNMCEQVFPLRIEFDKHYLESYGLSPVYTCSFCNKTAEKYSTFRSHCYRHITEGRYKCQECPKGFSLQSMLHVHVLAKHTKSKPYMCEECGKSFVTRPGLRIHLRKHKTESKEDYPCVVCGKILHTRGGLTSHMNVHRLGRRFMCDVCGKTFTQKVNMQQHVKQHTGDKPHGCDKCGKTFAERSHLARHYSFHSDQRPFKCDVCQKMYKTERCLKVHSLVHASERPFVCSYCNKGFLSSTKLKQHYNIHTGERPYKCKYCERTFTNYPNWLKHTRRRHKVDHKTGEELEPKEMKDEMPATPMSLTELQQVNAGEEADEILADISLSKTEELFLQQGLLNFPLTDDKFIIPQQIDLLTSSVFGTSSSTMGLLSPYLQNQSHQTIMQHSTTNSIPLQFTDILTNQYLLQQSLQ